MENYNEHCQTKWPAALSSSFSFICVPGEIDLEILKQIKAKDPRIVIDNDVIEPSAEQIAKYKGIIYSYYGLDVSE